MSPGPKHKKKTSSDRPSHGAPAARSPIATRSAREHGKSGGTFVDRSGKVHNLGKRRDDTPVSSSGPTLRPAHVAPIIRPLTPDSPEIRFKKKNHERSAGKPHRYSEGVGSSKGGFSKKKNPKDRNRKPEGKKFKGKDFERAPRAANSDRPARNDRGGDRGPQRGPRHESEGGFHRGSRRDSRPTRREGSVATTGQIYKATVDKNRKGFAFLIFESRDLEDAFVPPREAEGLFHGDRVEVRLSARDEVVGLKVIEHRFREVVGKYTPHPTQATRGGWVVYEQKRAREEIYIADLKGQKVEADDWVRVKLQFNEDGPYPVTGEVLDVYGKTLPPSADVGMIAAEFNLIEEHSEASEAEARAQKLEIPGNDLEGRDDLREVPFITIDGETARDFDDAVYVERAKSGHVLWVAIADVSHYVKEGSALDKDARSRGTSVYFPERAFHMLPRALSENLCSLKPNEPRLAMVAKMFFDRDGKIQETEMMEAVIQSKRRATYNEIQKEWDENKKNPAWEYHPHFELFGKLKKSRHDRGSIDFDLPEAELIVQPTGEVVSIKHRARLDAHRLIEEFMIAANEAATEWMMARGWPFVYRVHEEPATENLLKFQKLAATVGVKFSIEESAESPKVMADLVKRLEGHPAQALLNMALLRSLKQAVYSSVHGIHYGLASEGYTHFTSPIRRYPDLIVHRLLRRALRTEKGLLKPLNAGAKEQLEAELTDICEHCSYRERLASDAERESIKLKQVRAMLPHLGDEFESKINGMIETGLFTRIDDPYCEGMINRESMMDDFYVFNEERMVFYGRRKKRTFKVGDSALVRVLRADIERRQIDFGLVDGGPEAIS